MAACIDSNCLQQTCVLISDTDNTLLNRIFNILFCILPAITAPAVVRIFVPGHGIVYNARRGRPQAGNHLRTRAGRGWVGKQVGLLFADVLYRLTLIGLGDNVERVAEALFGA